MKRYLLHFNPLLGGFTLTCNDVNNVEKGQIKIFEYLNQSLISEIRNGFSLLFGLFSTELLSVVKSFRNKADIDLSRVYRYKEIRRALCSVKAAQWFPRFLFIVRVSAAINERITEVTVQIPPSFLAQDSKNFIVYLGRAIVIDTIDIITAIARIR